MKFYKRVVRGREQNPEVEEQALAILRGEKLEHPQRKRRSSNMGLLDTYAMDTTVSDSEEDDADGRTCALSSQALLVA